METNILDILPIVYDYTEETPDGTQYCNVMFTSTWGPFAKGMMIEALEITASGDVKAYDCAGNCTHKVEFKLMPKD